MTDKQIIIDGTQCRYAHFDGGNTQRLLCAIDDCFCDCHRENECYYKQLKRSEAQCEAMFVTHTDLEKKYKAKEQECEELKEARKNSRCAWKSLEGTFCPEAQEQLEAYKMEAEEGKEINAELKAENEELTTINARLLGRLEVDEKDTSLVFNLDKELRQKEKEFYTAIQKVVKLKQTLTEIKEIIRNQGHIDILEEQILQKISECEGNDETN